jgi:hypothetical protein
MFSDPSKRSTGPARALAAILVVALTSATLAPPLALAESDQEGEGTAPPTLLPGLDEGEPRGPETTLEEVAPAPGEEEAEEVVPPVTVESEPPPTATTEAAPPVEVTPPASVGEPSQSEPARLCTGPRHRCPATNPHRPLSRPSRSETKRSSPRKPPDRTARNRSGD